MVTRPLGGWILRHRPERIRAALVASILAGTAGTVCLSLARPLPLAIIAAALVGLASGMPFAVAFTSAARTRPEAPATAVGFVNGTAALVIVAGTPLLGLSFAAHGNGRLAFLVVAALWASALLALPSERELVKV